MKVSNKKCKKKDNSIKEFGITHDTLTFWSGGRFPFSIYLELYCKSLLSKIG